ncbi:MAG TPA: DMT family transporter [Aestuariivirgaceae bacterium]|nr:DMT family transporter [Aestuariivirgaceae bacterium]
MPTHRSFYHLMHFVLLGCFWGLSPSLYKLMGEAGVPVLHIIVLTGFGVGIALGAIGAVTSRTFALTREVLVFGFGCGAIMNVPFGLSLLFARHVPPAEYALIVSTAPFFNYIVALIGGSETGQLRRLIAVATGFVSGAILVLSRHGVGSEAVSAWLPAAFIVPIIYTLYNWFAARFWPRNADILAVGTAESIFSGLVALPLMLIFAPIGASVVDAFGYWLVVGATVMWIIERITFFTLIRDKGALYTIQAVYVATPAGVIFALLIFGGRGDPWIWASLGLLMVALWLNNRQPAADRR